MRIVMHFSQVSYFLIGVNIKTLPELPGAQLAAGHTISSHTMNHLSLPTITLAQVAREFNDARAQFVANTCIDPTLYRPPYGDTNANIQALTQRMGIRGVLCVAAPALCICFFRRCTHPCILLYRTIPC
jgi:peptidoglycan/xylan/chitin deacetylase (PgdA/CDA1 family)